MTPNQHNDLAANLSTMNSRRMLNVLAWIVTVASCFLCAAFYAYFQEFHGGFSSRQDVWGQFGDFIGGILNPILSFLSLIALVLTVVLQSRQLEMAHEELQNSKSELEATREQLKRSADAQRLTASALEDQAKHAVISAQLSALQASLQISSESLRQMQQNGIFGGPSAYQALLQRKEAIATEILRITDQLCVKA